MILFVVNLTGERLRIDVEQQDSVLTLKKRVQSAEGYELEEIGLVSAGQMLENDSNISDYHFQNESSLELVSMMGKR